MPDFAFTVDLAGLEDLIARMGAFERRAEVIVSDVDSRVNRLHGEWSGQAAGEHLAAHRRWRRGSAEMHEAAVTLRRIVSTAQGNYGAALAANARMWG